MQDGIKKTALAREIFGRGGAELIPLLNNYKNMLGEYTDVINAFSMSGERLKKFADDSDDIGDRFQIIGMVIKKLKLEFVDGLYPAIKHTQEQFLKFAIQNKKQIFEGIAKSIMLISKGFEFAIKGIKLFGEASARLSGDMKWISDNKNKNNATKLLNALMEFAKVLPVLALLGKAIKLVTATLGPWGMAFLVIIAAIDDLIAYMNGEGSIIGAIETWIKDPSFNTLPEKFKTMFNDIKKSMNAFYDWFDQTTVGSILKESVQGEIDKLKKIRFDHERSQFHEYLKKGQQDAVGKEISSDFQQFIDSGTFNLDGVTDYLNAPPTQIPGIGIQSTGDVTNEFKIDQKIEVNVETGADPETIGEEVGKKMKDEMDRTLRQAQQAIESGES